MGCTLADNVQFAFQRVGHQYIRTTGNENPTNHRFLAFTAGDIGMSRLTGTSRQPSTI